MIRLLVLAALFVTIRAHARNPFDRRSPRKPVPSRTATIKNSLFSLNHGNLYRAEDGGPPRVIARSAHLIKIARFGNLVAGLTYEGDLLFWQEGEDHAWHPLPTCAHTHEVKDFSANENLLVALTGSGRVQRWTSPLDVALVVDADYAVGVEGYSNDPGFGLIKSDGSKVYLNTDALNCGTRLAAAP